MASLAKASPMVIASVLLLITTALEKIKQCRRALGSVIELERLQVSLLQNKKTLNMVQGLQQGTGDDTSLDNWLLQLKDAVYEAEDIMDEMQYAILQSGSCLPVSRASPWSSSTTEASCLYNEHFAGELHKVLQQLQHITNIAEEALITKEGNGSGHHCRAPVSKASSSVTALSVPQLFGRRKEQEDLVASLTDSNHHHLPLPTNQHLPMVAAIVGMGGIGKTTLVRAICGDSRVEQYFDKIIWTCLTSMFGRREIMQEIVKSALTDQEYDSRDGSTVSFEHLQSELQRVVASRKVLFILDDVWNDEQRSQHESVEEWRAILNPFRSARQGSKILVTTRTRVVSESLRANLIYSLDLLGSSDCVQLMKEQALHGCSCNAIPEEIDQIRRLILDKAKGLPLAVVTLGRSLQQSKNITADWKQLLDANKSSLDTDVLPSLKLSYDAIPPQLQRCFAYCSLFPKGARLDPQKLVQQWIAHDFVRLPSEADKTMEDVGREYFNHLVSCSFFQPLKQGDQNLYTMHDLMHELAKFVSADECLLVEADMPHAIPPTIRHLSITVSKLAELKTIRNLNKIRTLVIFGKMAAGKHAAQPCLHLSTELPKMKRIRVLDVSSFQEAQFPATICKLTHLRYLALNTGTERLPAMANLLFLQSLILPPGSSLKELPADIKRLINLRHLHVDAKHLATIPELGRLTALQELDEFVVRKGSGDKSNIEELRYLNNLHGQLCIKNLNNVQSIEEASNAELPKKQRLNTLSLEWSAAAASRGHLPTMDAQVLESLKPPTNLEVLQIARYRGGLPPTWFTLRRLRNLKSLFLTNCRRLQVLPPLGQLPFLKHLHMKELCAVDHIGEEFYGADDVVFPSLRDLELDDLPKLAKWQEGSIHNHIAFPRLKRLTLSNCPQLVQVPPFPPTATTIMIEHTGFIPYMRLNPASSKSNNYMLEACTTTVLNSGLFANKHLEAVVNFNFRCNKQQPVMAKELQVLTSLQRLTLSHCGLSNEKLSMCLHALPISLSSLEIVDLNNITALPLQDDFSYNTNLHELSIRNCVVLSSLSCLENFTSLKCLIIERCPMLIETSFPNLRSLTSLKMLTIIYCKELQSLPLSSLPTSLESVRLVGCHPNLNKQLNSEGNVKYPKVLIS